MSVFLFLLFLYSPLAFVQEGPLFQDSLLAQEKVEEIVQQTLKTHPWLKTHTQDIQSSELEVIGISSLFSKDGLFNKFTGGVSG